MIIANVANDLGGGGGNNPPVASFTDAINGLTVSFTDKSTDSDGSIAARKWTFGDGHTSTATNPTHTYASAGNYTVKLTVTDNDGATNSTSQTVAAGSTQLLGNPGFETGTAAPWSASTGVIDNNQAEPAHTGLWKAWLDGYGQTHTDTLSQRVSIPSGKSSATLKYYLHVSTSESGTQANDKMTVQILNTSGTVLATVASFSNLNAAPGYAVHTANLAAYIGRTVVVRFRGTENATLLSSFVLDDVTLTVK